MAMSDVQKNKDRFEVLKAMDVLARHVNDEGFYYGHWTLIVPDEAEDEELLEIAASCPESYNEAVECFMSHFGEYVLEGGLYVGGEVYPKKEVAQ